VTRDELIEATRRLVTEGKCLRASPSLAELRTWLQVSGGLLAGA